MFLAFEACNVPRKLLKNFSKGVTHWLYTADKNIKALKFLNIPTDKITKIPNAMPIDKRNFKYTREELGIPPNSVVFTLVARGIKRKGWRAAIEAFLQLEQQFKNIHLLLCGDGDEVGVYKNKYNDHSKITFLGYQSEINGIYRISDCAIVPTRFEGESFPLCIIQAMQESLPIISTDVGEIKTMLTNNKNKLAGIILPCIRDTEEFINNLSNAMKIMMSSDKRSTFSERSKNLSQNYSMENLAIKYAGIFEKHMRKNLYIHIGLPKTGTSAIQKFLLENSEVLSQKFNICYPSVGLWKDGSHHNLAFSMVDTAYGKAKSHEKQKEILDELENEIEKSGCSNIVLSSECFHLYKNDYFIERVKRKYNVKIICYLRRQDEYLESIYSQNVRDNIYREKRMFHDFISEFMEHVNFSKLLKNWEKITEKDNFHIQVYDKSKFLNKNIIDDFMSIFSIKVSNDFNKNTKFINVSYTPTVTLYKALINYSVPEPLDELIPILQEYSILNMKNQFSFLSSKERNNIIDNFTEENQLISERYSSLNLNTIESRQKNLVIPLNESQIYDISKFIHQKKPKLIELIYSKADHRDSPLVQDLVKSAQKLVNLT